MKKISLIAAALVGAAVLCVSPISLHQAQNKGLSLSVDKAAAYTYGHHRRVHRRVHRRHYYYHHGHYYGHRGYYHGHYRYW